MNARISCGQNSQRHSKFRKTAFQEYTLKHVIFHTQFKSVGMVVAGWGWVVGVCGAASNWVAKFIF
jgi:hypothetical protein